MFSCVCEILDTLHLTHVQFFIIINNNDFTMFSFTLVHKLRGKTVRFENFIETYLFYWRFLCYIYTVYRDAKVFYGYICIFEKTSKSNRVFHSAQSAIKANFLVNYKGLLKKTVSPYSIYITQL